MGEAPGDVCQKTGGGSAGVCEQSAGVCEQSAGVCEESGWRLVVFQRRSKCKKHCAGRGRREGWTEWLLATTATAKPSCQTGVSSLSHRHTQ